MEAEYLSSAIPDPVIILGHQLRPFSLGHVKILRRFSSPFLCAGTPGLDDLVFGVFVCCQTYADALDALANGIRRDPVFPMYLLGAGTSRVPYAEYVRLLRISIGAFDVSQKILEFAGYVSSGSQQYTLENPPGDGRAPGAPLVQRIEQTLVLDLHYDRDRLQDMPWGLLKNEYLAFCERRDWCRIQNDEERQARARMADILAEIEKEKANGGA